MAIIVNGERIEDSVVQREVERLRPHYEEAFADQEPAEREAQLLKWSRENVIERVLIDQEAKQNGAKIANAEVESAVARLKEQYENAEQLYREFGVEGDDKLRQAIERQMSVEQRLQEVGKDLAVPSQSAIREYYERNKEQFKSEEQARVAHIVKYVNWQTDEETAHKAVREAQDKVKQGVPFEVVVDEYTDCGDSGGDLGYVRRGQLVEEFEDVVFNLGVGEVSDVFRSRFGFHIAKVYDKKPPAIPDLEEVKGQIKNVLREQMQEETINEFIDGLKSKAVIEEA
jgi:parvulin-like peptidyl-prolyl isomerase